MKAIEKDSPGNSENQSNKPSDVIGAEHLAQSERDDISVKDISMSVWERNNLGKNIVFTEEEVGVPLFLVPIVMRVFHTYPLCLEEGGA